MSFISEDIVEIVPKKCRDADNGEKDCIVY